MSIPEIIIMLIVIIIIYMFIRVPVMDYLNKLEEEKEIKIIEKDSNLITNEILEEVKKIRFRIGFIAFTIVIFIYIPIFLSIIIAITILNKYGFL